VAFGPAGDKAQTLAQGFHPSSQPGTRPRKPSATLRRGLPAGSGGSGTPRRARPRLQAAGGGGLPGPSAGPLPGEGRSIKNKPRLKKTEKQNARETVADLPLPATAAGQPARGGELLSSQGAASPPSLPAEGKASGGERRALLLRAAH